MSVETLSHPGHGTSTIFQRATELGFEVKHFLLAVALLSSNKQLKLLVNYSKNGVFV